MKKKKRNKNLINVLSFLNEAVETEKTVKIKNLLSQTLNRANLLKLYNALLELKEGEMTNEILLLLNSKEAEINKILNSPEIKLDPSYKKVNLEQIKNKFNEFFEIAKKEAEYQKTVEREAIEKKPFDDYWGKVFKVYRDGIEQLEAEIQNLESKGIKTDKLEEFKQTLKDERTTATRREAFDMFITNLKKDTSASSSYELYREKGEKYQEYLKNEINNLQKDISKRINSVKQSAEKEIKIPEIQPTRQIPQMQIPQEEPAPAPTSILGQIGSGITRGVKGVRAALGLEEELVRKESLQESLQLKKLSLKEAMEKEYD